MSTSDTLDNLRSRIVAGYPLLFLRTWEEERWEAELSGLALEMERGLVVWTVTRGPEPPPNEAGDGCRNPLEFLDQVTAYPTDHLFLLKDFHPYLSDPQIVRKLRDLSVLLATQNKTLLFMGAVNNVPVDLKKDAVAVELPLPGAEELRDELAAVLQQRKDAGQPALNVGEEDEDRILKAVLGLTAREAHKSMIRALFGRDRIDDDVLAALVSEKRNMVEGSDLLEFYDFDEGVKDVGGLENLKDWIARRAEAFSARAREQGIPTPKGVLLLGVQGCGKSLTARATARLLSFPLVRLDVANLLSSDRGSSEKNMRDVLRLIETIAPAVLWVDEIEKGFAGSGGESDATMSRLVGSFLTWMGELSTPVFVVATANSVTGLPPEMLRRGRFDELFFIDLPNYHERMQIFEIHLAKRGWKPELYDLIGLASNTEGFSGAEIEQIVVSAMLDAYGRGGLLSQEDLQQSRDTTVPLSVTMEEKVFELREWAASRCRRATPDSRVTQMLEEEHRRAELSDDDDEAPARSKDPWIALAEHGQVPAAIVECVRRNDPLTLAQLQDLLAPYMETTGEQGLSLRSDPNIVLWAGMSRELTETLSKMIEGKRLYLHPGKADDYKTLGKGLKLNVLPELTDERAPRPVWFPVTLRVVPATGGSSRLGRVTRVKLTR